MKLRREGKKAKRSAEGYNDGTSVEVYKFESKSKQEEALHIT